MMSATSLRCSSGFAERTPVTTCSRCQRELEEAQAFNAWLGERRLAQEGQRRLDDVSRLTEAVRRQVPQLCYARAERRGVERAAGEVAALLDQPDRKATTFVTSHFYLDDFVQSSEDPNPQPLQHTPLRAIPEEGFRTPAEATDEDLARMRQGGGNRFGEDDLAGDPEADALTNNGQGPPSITGRLRSAADGAQAAADLVGAGAAGLAAVQAFRSQLPQDAAEYVRPRPGPQPQPPPQIIGRPDDVERLLDEAGQRAQEVERGAAQAIEETAAVAAEEGEVAVAAKGVGGGFGPGAAALAPTAGEVAGAMAATAGVGAAATAGLAVRLAGGAAYGLARGTGWVLENTLFRPQQGSEDAAVQDVRSANNMNDATQPQHFTLRSGSSTSGSPASSASSQSGADLSHAAPLLLGPEPCDSAPVPAELPGKLPQLRTPEPPASTELRPAGPRHQGGLDSPSPYEQK